MKDPTSRSRRNQSIEREPNRDHPPAPEIQRSCFISGARSLFPGGPVAQDLSMGPLEILLPFPPGPHLPVTFSGSLSSILKSPDQNSQPTGLCCSRAQRHVTLPLHTFCAFRKCSCFHGATAYFSYRKTVWFQGALT